MHRMLVRYSDVSVIESNDRGLTLEFRPQYFSRTTVNGEGEVYQLPQFKNSLPAASNRPGGEDVRVRILSLALPSYRGNTATVVGADIEEVKDYQLAPVATMEVGGTFRNGQLPLSSQFQFFAGFPAEVPRAAL